MAKKTAAKLNTIKLYYDSQGNTLNVWFDDPMKECVSEETGEDVILNKNKQGKVIGFEKLNYLRVKRTIKSLPVEVVVS